MAALALFEMTFTNPEAFVLGNDVSPENRADRALDVLERLTDAKGGKTREVRTRVAKDAFLTLCDPVKVELSTRSEWR